VAVKLVTGEERGEVKGKRREGRESTTRERGERRKVWSGRERDGRFEEEERR